MSSLAASKTIGFVYNPRLAEAYALAKAIARRLGLGEGAWMMPADEMERYKGDVKHLSLLITVGGDGTILRAARLAGPSGVPILGVNMGRLGFMTELRASEALDQAPRYVDGDVRVEERAMLQAILLPADATSMEQATPPCHGLNDAVVGRGVVARLINVRAKIDGVELTTYRADAVVVATATGSTGYTLAVGGPIMSPLSRELLLKPVAAHLGMPTALVLSPTATVALTLVGDQTAMLSVDGYMDTKLSEGDTVYVSVSPHTVRFLRANPPSHFYRTLTRRLGLSGDGQTHPRALPQG